MERMMNLIIRALLTFVLSVSSFSNQHEIGKIVKLKGNVSVTRANTKVDLSLNESILLNDLIKTKTSSFIKIEFLDKTNVVIGPSSELLIQKFTLEKESIFNLIKGKFRAKVNKKVTKENTLIVKTNIVSLAIRGTEFLMNSYLVEGKSVTDAALLKGSIQTTIKETPSFMLNHSQAFNTNQLAIDQTVKELSPETVESLLKDSESFLPNIQNSDGTFNSLDNLIKNHLSTKPTTLNLPTSSSNISPAVGITAGLGTAVGLVSAGNDDDKDESSNKDFPQKIKVSQPIVKEKESKPKLNLAKLPWSIRDALLRRNELLEKNECFYWFFKKIPGGGEKELFRRERDCNEFDNDL